MVRDYEIELSLQDDNTYGENGTKKWSFTLTIEAPLNELPVFAEGTLQTELFVEVETAWSYKFPAIINPESHDVITTKIISDESDLELI